MWADIITWKNPSEWCDIVKRNGYGVIVEITNHDIIGNDTFKRLTEGFGISSDDITTDTDFLVISSEEDTSVVDNGHGSGDRNATILGEISVFYNDNGGYGVYLDGNECIIVNEPDNSDNIDIRISVVNTAIEELIWTADMDYN
jgi:hypothetical protein